MDKNHDINDIHSEWQRDPNPPGDEREIAHRHGHNGQERTITAIIHDTDSDTYRADTYRAEDGEFAIGGIERATIIEAMRDGDRQAGPARR